MNDPDAHTRPDPAPAGAWRARALSFVHAGRGLAHLVRTQPNARIHLAATVAVVGAGAWVRLSRAEWCAVIAAIGIVWTAEGLNTAVERLADAVRPDHHPLVGRAKDVAAGGVLAAAIAAAAIGLVVFVPHLVHLAR